MKLTVLGCAGTFPSVDSPCSSYLVEHDGFRLVLDLGAGALGQLQKHIGLLDVDAVYLSHLHSDHCIDLVAYSYARRYHPDGIAPCLAVYGPRGTAARLVGAYEVAPADGLKEVFDFREVPDPDLTIGPFTVTTARMNHPVECHAIRLEAGGRSLVYSGDTGVTPNLVELARDADLLLCEASWEHDDAQPEGVHLSGQQAGEHAAQAGVQRLLLTHVVAWSDPAAIEAEARTRYDGPLEIVRCGRSYEV